MKLIDASDSSAAPAQTLPLYLHEGHDGHRAKKRITSFGTISPNIVKRVMLNYTMALQSLPPHLPSLMPSYRLPHTTLAILAYTLRPRHPHLILSYLVPRGCAKETRGRMLKPTPTGGVQWNVYYLHQSHHLYRPGDKLKSRLFQPHHYPRLHGQPLHGDRTLLLNPLTSLIRISVTATSDEPQ